MATTSWLDRIRDLDWLGLFVASWVVPFILDDVHRLTYFSSLAFWLVPTLLLLPRFLEYTDSGGRRRSAMLLTTISVVAMGVLLDVFFGHVILQFDESATASYIAWLTVPVLQARVPIEEFLFYAMAPIATLLIYGWASEYWIVRYTPSHDQAHLPEHGRIVAVSIRALVGAVILMAIGLAVFARNPVRAGVVPPYFTFLIVLAFVPAVLLFSTVREVRQLAGLWRDGALSARHLDGLGGDARRAAALVGLQALSDARHLGVGLDTRSGVAIPARSGPGLVRVSVLYRADV